MESGPISAARRILAIDDDPISLAITAILLESDGWTVTQAEGGEQALELLAAGDAGSPDCILTDLRMPGLCGTELAVRLRRAAPSARLMAMTATPPPGVDGYEAVLAKPLAMEALRAALSTEEQATEEQAAGAAGGAVGDGPECVDEAIFERLRAAMPDSALKEVIGVFLEDALRRIASIRGGDAAAIQREAHTVKGGASMIGACQAAATAAAIESGIDDEGERIRKLDELEAHCRRAEVILLQRLKL